MPSEGPGREPEKEASLHASPIKTLNIDSYQESIRASLALLLGPETEYHMRIRATRRLVRQGPVILPLLLTTLSNYPEITAPAWPNWPPQYEHCSRLLIHLSQHTQVRLEAFLAHPALSQPAGPVLWTSVIEAARLLLHEHYEALLRDGLRAQWATVRYAAAMALAYLTGAVLLEQETVDVLYVCQREEEPAPLRLAASYALLRNQDSKGLEVLIQLMDSTMPHEARKAAIFVLATEPPSVLAPTQREQITQCLVYALQDVNSEVAQNAARALRTLAAPSTLPALCRLLQSVFPHIQVAALMALEEMASRKALRKAIHYHTLPSHVVPLLRSLSPEVRRQACYTLAAFGGEYAAAVLGTTLLNHAHPGRLEAIEGLRLLQNALHASTRTKVTDWLLAVLKQPDEEVRVTALDSLAYLLWLAHTRGHHKAFEGIGQQISQDRTVLQLLTCRDAWVRQRTIELLSMVHNPPASFHSQVCTLLHTDEDSGVRACIAYILGQTATRWAIPDLLLALLDPDEHVAETALHALGDLASPDDVIVVYVLKELTRLAQKDCQDGHPLAQAAHDVLKKWR